MPVFFAQAISSRQVRTIELYFTKENVPTAAECANLCGQRHFFCQSAIYNHDLHTCALSPTKPVQCALSKQRFNYFHLKTDGADALSLISCIQTCQTTTLSPNLLSEELLNKEETRTTKQTSPEFSSIHDEEKSELKNKKTVETKQLLFPGDVNALDVLQRLYQMRQRLEQILSEANRGSKASDQTVTSLKEKQPQNDQGKTKENKPAKTNFSSSKMNKNDTEILIQSGGFVARLKPDEQIQKQSINKSKQQKQNIDDLNKNNTTFSERKQEESEYYKEGEDEEPIIVNGKLIEPATGYLHSVLIHHSGGISSEENDKTTLNDDNKILPSLDVARLSKSNTGTIICFKFIQNRKLHDYGRDEISIGIKKGLSLNECRCACADTWKLKEETTRCKSLQYKEGLCELLNADHNGKTDLIFNKSSDYHYVSCEGKYLLKTADKMCSNKSEQNKTTLNNNTKETNILIKSEQITNKTFDFDSVVQQTTTLTTTTNIKTIIDVDNNRQCFERILGYSMNGTAASLVEHNVSIESCKCLCANSLHSRYPFHCASVSYFSNERDCVLNLHNRQSAPEQFSREPEQQVIYLGFICRPKEATDFVENVCNNIPPTNKIKTSVASNVKTIIETTEHPNIPETTTVNSTTELAKDQNDSSTSLSDSCFVEQPGYVLEGMAVVARQQISAELCKCICALTEWKFQQQEEEKSLNVSNLIGGCSSSQFYKHSGTCLVSRDNRVSAPERFIFDANSQNGIGHSSYLDFRCGADKKALLAYITSNCPKELIKSTLTNTLETTTKNIENVEDKPKNSKKPKKDKKVKKHKKSEKLNTQSKIEEENITSTTIISSTTLKMLSAEKEEEQLETKTAIPSIESKTTSDLDSLLLEGGENWKTIKAEGEKHLNKLEQGGDEKEEEEEEEKFEVKRVSTSTQNDPPPEQNKHENSNYSLIVNDTTTINIIEPTIFTTSTPNITESLLNNQTIEEILNINNSTNLLNQNITTESSSFSSFSSTSTGSNLFEYPPVGQCHFSALYQTVFNGARLLKRLLVDTPAQCLAACHYESCRSANLIQMEDKQKICELFRDSIVEFRRNDVLSFDRLAVHFDSIQCKPREE